MSPSGVTRLPAESKSKDPARVKRFSLPRPTMKKPSPEIIRLVSLPVTCAEPWPKLVDTPPTCTPRPTWIGLVPPCPFTGAAPAVSIWLRVSWKTTLLALKPAVFALAMLLPVTSSMNWLARRPLIAEKSERSMVGGPGCCVGRKCVGSGRGDLDDAGEGDLGTADPEHRTGGGEPDGVDR